MYTDTIDLLPGNLDSELARWQAYCHILFKTLEDKIDTTVNLLFFLSEDADPLFSQTLDNSCAYQYCLLVIAIVNAGHLQTFPIFYSQAVFCIVVLLHSISIALFARICDHDSVTKRYTCVDGGSQLTDWKTFHDYSKAPAMLRLYGGFLNYLQKN